MSFELHPRLAADCVILGDGPLCRWLLMNESRYPWFILVPRRTGVREIHELSQEEQQQWLQESSLLGRAAMQAFSGDKLNLAAIGNMVPQLHVHHIVRYENDAAWPGPVWGRFPPEPYTAEEQATVMARLLAALPAQTLTPV